MSWIQIRFLTDDHHSERVEEAVLAAGALSVTYEDQADQPIFEPPIGTTPLWKDIRLTALFSADIDVDSTLQEIATALGDYHAIGKAEILEDKDWEREWMSHYKPMAFGDRLWICPSWTPPPQPEAINLMLDPGLAFGTGTHPTTALCLRWLDGQDLQGKVVVDFGCGSGILAIAALLLGASKAIAIDIDPQALIATADNAERNGVKDERLVICLPEHTPKVNADIVIANILAGPLISLKPILSGFLSSGGDIVLSGLLDTQAEGIQQHYADEFDLNPTTLQGEWGRIDGKKR